MNGKVRSFLLRLLRLLLGRAGARLPQGSEEAGKLRGRVVVEQERDAFALGDGALNLPGEDGQQEQIGEQRAAEELDQELRQQQHCADTGSGLNGRDVGIGRRGVGWDWR